MRLALNCTRSVIHKFVFYFYFFIKPIIQPCPVHATQLPIYNSVINASFEVFYYRLSVTFDIIFSL